MKKILFFVLFFVCGITFNAFSQVYVSDFDALDQLSIVTTNVSVKDVSYTAPSGAKTGVSLNGGEVKNSTSTITAQTSSTTTTPTDFTFDLQSAAGTSGNGADGADFVKVEVSIDGGSTYIEQLNISGNSNARWLYNSAEAAVIYSNPSQNFQPASGGDRTTDGDGYSKIKVSAIPAGDVVIKITLKNNSSNEYWCVDNLKLEGNSTSSISISPNSLDLSYEEGNGPSSASSFQVTGSNLSQGITMSLNGNTDFEWKKSSETTYSSTDLSFPATGGTVDVRLIAGLSEGTYSATGAASSGSVSENISLNGTVTAPPVTCSGSVVFSDDFSTGLDKWSNNGDWANVSNEMKHNATGSGSSYNYGDVGTFDLTNNDFEWQVRMRNDNWDPSSSNKFWFYLSANSLNFSNSNFIDGYAVGVNMSGTSDLLTLYKVTDGVGTAIITSTFDWSEDENVSIRVTRSQSGNWTLYYQDNGGAEENAGSAMDVNYTTDGQYFGPNFVYSSTRAGKFYIDDVSICGATISSNLDIYEPTPDMCESVTMDIPAGTEYVDILKDGDIIAQINPNGNNLGNYTIDVFESSSSRKDADNTHYLNRSIFITPVTQPSSAVSVRLFLTLEEYNQLVTDATNGGDPDVPGTINDLNITKVSGINCSTADGDFYAGGTIELISPTAVQYGTDYYLEFNVNSFSGFFIHGGASVLPVEWNDIKVETNSSNNVIHWEVENEINVEHYVVENSRDGKNWETIGNVAFNSNSGRYNYTDINPINSISYYRIKQIDFDGQYSYSETVTARRNSNSINIYPNPVNKGDKIIVNCDATSQVKLFDAIGRNLDVPFIFENETVVIPTLGLNPGIYFIRINDNLQKLIIK